MVKRLIEKNLFGQPVPQQRPRYEAALGHVDKRQNAARAARMRWLREVTPKNIGYILPVETALAFEEARSCFIYGNFIATVLLAAAFVEHWLVSNLESRGHSSEASRGLAAAIKFARAKNLVDHAILDRADHLRLIRNPFVHLKEFGHEYTVSQRASKDRTDPWTLIEGDAKEALIAMYGIAKYASG